MHYIVDFFRSLPRWYVALLWVLLVCYLGGWVYTIHLAHVERAAGAAYVMPVAPHDSTSYAQSAQSLLQGRFTNPGEVYEYFHTPGYPAFAAVLLFISGDSFFAVTFAQILLVFATAFMTCALGARLASERVGLWASLLFLANPLVPSIALYVLTDVLFMFLLTLGILLLVTLFEKRPLWSALWAGIVFAAAVYVRPVGSIAIPIFVAPLVALAAPFKKKLLYGAGMLAIIGILILPWMIRNKIHSGVFSFSSLFALNMAYYEIPHYWAWDGAMTVDEGIQKVAQESGVPEGLNQNGYPANWYNLASSPALDRYVIGVVLQSPVRYGLWHLYNSIGGFFLNPAINPPGQNVNLKQLLAHGHFGAFLRAVMTPWWLLLERLGIALGLFLMAIGMWALRRKPLAWAFLFIILYLSALGGSAAESRLRLPVEPLISIIMVAGIGALLKFVPFKKGPMLR